MKENLDKNVNKTPRCPLGPVRRILKWIGVGAGVLVALFVLVCSLIVWILTPERLTPMIGKYGSEYLTADVSVEHAELTFWRTFPHLMVDIEGLEVRSRALDGVSDSIRHRLPVYADSLLSLKGFQGGVNVPALLVGNIRLYDITLRRPRINLVGVDASTANYLIVPKSDKERDTTALKLPDISLNRFVIEGGMPVSYVMLADSIDAAVTITTVDFDGSENPRYALEIDGLATATAEPWVKLARLPIEANGSVKWSPRRPMELELGNFVLGAGPIRTITDAKVDFGEPLTVNALKFNLEPVKIAELLEFVPEEYRAIADGVETDLRVAVALELLRQFTPGRDSLPTASFVVELPQGQVKYDGYTIDKLAMKVEGAIDGAEPDKSRVSLRWLSAEGEGVDFKLTGEATNLVSDPAVEGDFKGLVNFARLPKQLLSQAGVTVRGALDGKIRFRLRKSYLSKTQFHRILLNGDAELSNFDLMQSEFGAHIYADRMQLRLGTADSFVRNDMRSDSLLTASVKSDSLFAQLPGMELSSRGMMVGIGAKNMARTPGVKTVIPLGGVFKIDRLRFDSAEDSMAVRLRNVMCRASLQRYEDHARVPLLRLSLDAGGARYSDKFNRVNFRETAFDATCHLRLKPKMSKRLGETYDSLRVRYPRLSPDSVYTLALAEQQRRRTRMGAPQRAQGTAQTEQIDYGIDNSTKRLLKWIDFSGHLRSKRARLFTPYFPVRNRLSNIDISITPDSLNIANIDYRMDNSDLRIRGTVSNITNALTSQRQPMRIEFDITSDTIDVNRIAEAAFAGAAFAEKVAKGGAVQMADSDNDDMMQMMVETAAATQQAAPLLIPTNVEAELRMHSHNIIYSDLVLNNFRGIARVHDGALNLHELGATTDMGSVSLTALYNGRSRDDLSFAFGLDVKDLQLKKVMQLMPALDTVMPLLNSVSGIVNADVAAKTRIDSLMNFEIPSLEAAVKITGDSLVLLDDRTFATIAKWMLFKNKEHNMIDHMEVQLVVENSTLELFPFVFDMDRYRIGVMGTNDLALNLNYHVSVLKSPIPFKFGINVKGTPDKMKIRLGRAKFKDDMMATRIAIVDTTRINLINQIENVFRRGVSRARVSNPVMRRPDLSALNAPETGDTISAADSLLFINEGVLPQPPRPEPVTDTAPAAPAKRRRGR